MIDFKSSGFWNIGGWVFYLTASIFYIQDPAGWDKMIPMILFLASANFFAVSMVIGIKKRG